MTFGCSIDDTPNFSRLVGVNHRVVRKMLFTRRTVSGVLGFNSDLILFVIVITNGFCILHTVL